VCCAKYKDIRVSRKKGLCVCCAKYKDIRVSKEGIVVVYLIRQSHQLEEPRQGETGCLCNQQSQSLRKQPNPVKSKSTSSTNCFFLEVPMPRSRQTHHHLQTGCSPAKETKTNTVKKNTRKNIESIFFGKFNFDKDKKVLTSFIPSPINHNTKPQ